MMYILSLLFACFSLVGQPNFVLMGPPGSGKGTFSQYMKEHHGYTQICPGDIVRRHIKDVTELGKEIKPIVERGDYIADEIMFRIMEEQICYCIDNKLPFIIDGFPRSVSSFEFLNELLTKKEATSNIIFVHFNADDQTCINRIEQRLVCFTCSSIFNTTTKKPQQEITCDHCGNKLELRLGDNVAITTKRLGYYREIIEPVVELARTHYRVLEVDALLEFEQLIPLYQQVVTP